MKIVTLPRNLESGNDNVTRSERILGQGCRVARLGIAHKSHLHHATRIIPQLCYMNTVEKSSMAVAWLAALCLRVHGEILRPPSPCRRFRHSTFCFPKPPSSSKFPLPPAEALHRFSHPLTVRCHGSLPRVTLYQHHPRCLAPAEVTYWKCRVLLGLLGLLGDLLGIVLAL